MYSNLIAPYVSCKVYMTVSFSFNDNIGVFKIEYKEYKNFLIIVEVFVSFDAFIVL